MANSLLVSTAEQVSTFILNRPEKCNALDGDLIQALQDAFFEAGRNPNVQIVVLKGNGNHFCAGADIDWMLKLSKGSFEQSRDDARKLASLLSQIYLFPKPVIVLAHGGVLGGGLGLLACADIVLAEPESSFCFSEVKIGLVPAVVCPYMISIMGEHVARYYFLTGERFNAEEAMRLKLIHQVVSPHELSTRCQNIIKMLLNNSPDALREVKHMLPMVAGQEISLELSEKTAEIFAKMRVSAAAAEGLNAFIEKRKPLWK